MHTQNDAYLSASMDTASSNAMQNARSFRLNDICGTSGVTTGLSANIQRVNALAKPSEFMWDQIWVRMDSLK